MLPEYDLDSVPVLGRGPDFIRRQAQAAAQGRTPHVMVELAPDVAAHFPDAEAVNAALRMLIKARQPRRKTGTRSGR
jgi:hypothetical protein